MLGYAGYIIGGLAAGLLGLKVYRSQKKPLTVRQAEDMANAQRAAINQALKAQGINPQGKGIVDLVNNHVVAQVKGFMHNHGSAGTTPGPSKPKLVLGDPLNTVTGKTYYVTLSLSVPAFLAPRDKIVEEASNHGFVDIIASPTMPAGWPGGQKGDWYIKARAARPSQFQRKTAAMSIVEGFEQ